jgi:hypothetical protein
MKRRRRPGGGRKAQGELRNLTAVMSLRMPQDLRDQLERARRASGRSLSQEMLKRVGLSFGRDREGDRALRAFSFLFSELAEFINLEQNPDWRFDPWLFHTIKLAIGKLLDRFEPSGKMRLPRFWQYLRDTPDFEGLPTSREERVRITQSPEAMADYVVQNVLSDFNNPQRIRNLFKGWKGAEERTPNPFMKRVLAGAIEGWETTYYGMDKAQRDLAPKPKSRAERS